MPCWGNCADSLLQIKEKKKKKVHLRPHVTICDRASLKGSQDRRALAVPVTPVHRTVKQRNPERETVRACNESVRACERQPELCWDCCCYCCCSHWRVNVRACKERKKKKKENYTKPILEDPRTTLKDPGTTQHIISIQNGFKRYVIKLFSSALYCLCDEEND